MANAAQTSRRHGGVYNGLVGPTCGSLSVCVCVGVCVCAWVCTGKEAAMGPLRELPPSALVKVAPGSLRPISLQDFANALSVIKPSCNKEMLKGYEDFTREFGTQA